jgi:hypothetical protein
MQEKAVGLFGLMLKPVTSVCRELFPASPVVLNNRECDMKSWIFLEDFVHFEVVTTVTIKINFAAFWYVTLSSLVVPFFPPNDFCRLLRLARTTV